MGLRISQSFIESHGSPLWAANNSPRGAAVYLDRPVDAWHLREKTVHPETTIRARPKLILSA
jgi:K+-sensing histidine kinase KdpD